MSAKLLEAVLDDKGIEMVWADEVNIRGRGWSSVSDVGCNRSRSEVAVPRRRRDSYHWSEVLHEVAHMELWRWTDRGPATHDDAKVCQLALDIALQYGFKGETLEYLRKELADVTERSIGMNMKVRIANILRDGANDAL